MELARLARQGGKDQAASSYYIQSLNLYRGMDEAAGVVRCLIQLSSLAGWSDFGDGLDMFARRQKLAQEALPLARELGDQALLAETLCAFAAGLPHDQATRMLEESVTLARANGDTSLLARSLSRQGNAVSLSGEHERGKALYEQALALYEETGDAAGIASVLFSLAIRADGAEKRAHLERALALQRGLGAEKRMAEILMILERECDQSDLDQREAYNREAPALCRSFGSAVWEAGCLDRLAEIAHKRGDLAAAEALSAESRSVYEPPEVDPSVQEALEAAFESGDREQVTEALKRLFGS
jgi:tetratricopeptide (TPR) repeat protein